MSYLGASLTVYSTHPNGKARVAGPACRGINKSTTAPLPIRGDRSRCEHVVLCEFFIIDKSDIEVNRYS
jgi:hypothetical protein